MADKRTNVVLTQNSRGAKAGDVVTTTAERAEELIATGLAREPRPGEVKAAKDEGSSK